MKVVYSNSWKIKPFKHGRPFVPLKDYNDLKKKYDETMNTLKDIDSVVNNE